MLGRHAICLLTKTIRCVHASCADASHSHVPKQCHSSANYANLSGCNAAQVTSRTHSQRGKRQQDLSPPSNSQTMAISGHVRTTVARLCPWCLAASLVDAQARLYPRALQCSCSCIARQMLLLAQWPPQPLVITMTSPLQQQLLLPLLLPLCLLRLRLFVHQLIHKPQHRFPHALVQGRRAMPETLQAALPIRTPQ